MEVQNKIYWSRIVIVVIAGFVGVVSALPVIPNLLAITGQEPPLPMMVIQAISTLQSSVILFAMVLLGAWVSPKVNLVTPLLDAYLNRSWGSVALKPIVVSSLVGGILGGGLLLVFQKYSIPYLPSGFLESAQKFNPPFYTRLLYGGITEEILIRWGIMSFIVWGSYRLTQKNGSPVKSYNYLVGIFLAAIIFGLGHLPAANILSPVVTLQLLLYIVVGNSLFGLIAGFLFWKRGLESAVLAHMLAHVVMMVGEKAT